MGPTQNVARVEMNDICIRFGAVDALVGVNLCIAPGEVVGIVGDNGAGKSTLMKILSGAEIPNKGKVFIDGVELAFDGPRNAREHGIEMVYQDLALCNDLDVTANLFLGREEFNSKSRRLRNAKMHIEANSHLNKLHIRIKDTTQKAGTLSGGQRQAIAIARAVTFDPKILVLDEPTAALAAKEVDMVLKLIKDISNRGVSVILITHRLQDLFKVCDRLLVLYDGKIWKELFPNRTNLDELVEAMMGN